MTKRVKMTINSEAKKARADLERQEMFRKLLYCSNQESLPDHGEFMSDGLIRQFMRKIIFHLPLIFSYFSQIPGNPTINQRRRVKSGEKIKCTRLKKRAR